MITRELLLTEFAAAILVGTIPCLLVTLSGGLASTVDFLKAIDISDFSVKYALALFIMSLAVAGLAHFKQGYIEGVNYRVSLYIKVVRKSGSTLASIFRVLSGVLFALGFISIFNLEEAGIKLTLLCFSLFIFFLFAAALFELVSDTAHRLNR